MRALVYNGTKLALDNNYPPLTLAKGEALIRVLQVGICNTDLEIIRGYMNFTGVPGHEFVGIVEEVNCEAQQAWNFVGKRVVGEINAACHRPDCAYCQRGIYSHCPNRTTLGIDRRDGAFADYVMLPIENLHIVPENVSDEEAVFVEPLAANFEILEQIHMKPTDSVIVLGDGKMGQLAARVLSLSNCSVAMVGKHEEKLALVEPCGIATHLLKDIEQLATMNIALADHVVECTGSAQGIELAMSLVKPRGNLILKSTVADRSTLNLAPIVIDEIRVQGSRCGPFEPALYALTRKLIDVRPLIRATYSLDEGLAAFKYAEQPGVLKVVVRV